MGVLRVDDLKRHLKKRMFFRMVASCDCNNRWERGFPNKNTSILIWYHSKCNGQKSRAVSCPCEVERWVNGSLKETRGFFSSARELDEWLKSYGLIPEELQVGDRG